MFSYAPIYYVGRWKYDHSFFLPSFQRDPRYHARLDGIFHFDPNYFKKYIFILLHMGGRAG